MVNSKGSFGGDEAGADGRGERSPFSWMEDGRLRLLRMCERGEQEGGCEKGVSMWRDRSTAERREVGERKRVGWERVAHVDNRYGRMM